MNSRRWHVMVALVVIVSILLVGCSKGSGGPSQPSSGKNVRLVVRKYPKASLPYYKLTLSDPLMYGLMYDTLLLDDPAKGLQPLLADEWSFSDDKKTITWKLNPNAKFRNGEGVGGKDVEESFVLLQGGALSPRLGEVLSCLDKVEATGDKEVKMTLKKECPDAVRDFGTRILIINASSMEKGGYWALPLEEKLSGSGPFAVDAKASLAEKKLVLRATGTHYRLKPIVDMVTFEVVEDENVAESSVKIADVWPEIFGSE